MKKARIAGMIVEDNTGDSTMAVCVDCGVWMDTPKLVYCGDCGEGPLCASCLSLHVCDGDGDDIL